MIEESDKNTAVLILDRDPAFQAFATEVLEAGGFMTITPTGWDDAKAECGNGPYCAILVDGMLQGTGVDPVIGWGVECVPPVPVIVVSKEGSVDQAVRFMRLGAADYLMKPIPADLLLQAMVRAIRQVKGNNIPQGLMREGVPEAGRIFVATDDRILRLLAVARRIAPTRSTVLIQGESGTGKEMLAAYIHRHSDRPSAPYVAVNCAALPDNLAESELFGHEKGAFTGAVTRKPGKFELANGGTLVLDEIGEMSRLLQAKLLRALQERQVDRVGGRRPIPVDVRVIAISNMDLKAAVRDGRFREDLYYRIHVVPLVIPPLRERASDIKALAGHFVEACCERNHLPPVAIASETYRRLETYPWKGNVRELENTLERSVLMNAGPVLLPEHLVFDEPAATGADAPSTPETGKTVHDMEKSLIFNTLKSVDDNRTQAAKLLGISIRTLRNKLKLYQESG